MTADDPIIFPDSPEAALDAIEVFNTAMKNAPPLSWSPGKFALDLSYEDQTTEGFDE